MICPRLRRVLVGFYSMVARLGGLALVVLLVAGCGGGGAPPGVELVFRHSRMPGQDDPLPRLLRGFEREHPGVRVTHEPLPWTADVQHQFYVINLEGRAAGFDVLMVDVIWTAEFARAGWLLDLTDRWPAAERGEHFEATVATAMLDGRVWAVPWVMNVGLLYYRSDLLDASGFAPPRSYEELAHQARVVMERAADRRLGGFVWQGRQYEGLVVNVLEELWARGVELVATNGRVLVDLDGAAAALAFRRRLLTDGISPSLVTGADEEQTRREFGAGRAVFLRNWPYARRLFERPTSAVRGRVGVTALPGGGALGGAHLAINRATHHPELAWQLVRFLTSDRAQLAIAEAVGLHPTKPKLLEPALRSIFAAARPRPITPWYQTLSATMQPAFSAAITGVTPPRDALATARLQLEYFLQDP